MHRRGADCFAVAMKRGNGRGAKGAGHRRWDRVNRQREEPDTQWKAAAFMRWHEPYESRGSRTESVRGSGCNSLGLLGLCQEGAQSACCTRDEGRPLGAAL